MTITRWAPHPEAPSAMIESFDGDYVEYRDLERYRKALEIARDALSQIDQVMPKEGM